ELVQLLDHNDCAAGKIAALEVLANVLPDEARQSSLQGLRDDNIAPLCRVFTSGDGINVDRHRMPVATVLARVDRVAPPRTDALARKPIAAAAEAFAIVLAVRAAPGHCGPDHVRPHPVPVVNDGEFGRLLVRAAALEAEDDVNLGRTRLLCIIDEF